MKALFIAILLVSNVAFAAPKDEPCSKYMTAAIQNVPAMKQIPLIADVYNAAFELKFNEEEMKKLRDYLDQRVKTDKSALDNLGKGAYFACTTDLTAEEKEIQGEQIRSILGLVQPE